MNLLAQMSVGEIAARLSQHMAASVAQRPVVGGGGVAPVFLDSGASTRSIAEAVASLTGYDQTAGAILGTNYANFHRTAIPSAALLNDIFYQVAPTAFVNFFGADPKKSQVLFHGSGATQMFNKLFWCIFNHPSRGKRNIVITTEMDHHAILVPGKIYSQRAGGDLVIVRVDPGTGLVHYNDFFKAIRDYGDRIAVIAHTAASNVTGYHTTDKIPKLAQLAQEVGAPFILDASQAAAHLLIEMERWGVKNMVGGGHKLHAPRSPGYAIIDESLLSEIPYETGGAAAQSVKISGHTLADRQADREHTGTPDVLGVAAILESLLFFHQVGMKRIQDHEREVIGDLMGRLSGISGVRVYGDTELPRIATVTFNMRGISPAILAAALSDLEGIEIGPGNFGAQPYVESFGVPAMGRANLAIHNVPGDGERLVEALKRIAQNPSKVADQYDLVSGKPIRKDGQTFPLPNPLRERDVSGLLTSST